MSTSSAFSGFDGLMTLSRREGVDVRPTLLRVLTDLYVQAPAHTADEEHQFVELASRLIDNVDDATRAAVRARLSIYPHTPPAILRQLMVQPVRPAVTAPPARSTFIDTVASGDHLTAEANLRPAATMTMEPKDATDIATMFFAASRSERALILANLVDTPLKPAARILETRAARAIAALEAAAFSADMDAFARELAGALMLPAAAIAEIVADDGREPLACALKALGMPADIFQRVLLFLDPAFGRSVQNVYRLARFYDVLSERASLILLAAWRGSSATTARTKYKPSLYDDERARARAATPQARPAIQPGSTLPAQAVSKA